MLSHEWVSAVLSSTPSGCFEVLKRAFWGCSTHFGGQFSRFKALRRLDHTVIYGQTNAIKTESLGFTCMAVSTERSDAVGCTKSTTQVFSVEYLTQLFEINMRNLDQETGLEGSIIPHLRTPFPHNSILGQIVR